MQRDRIQTHSLIPEPGITALLPNSKSHFRCPPSIPGCCHLSRAYSILSCAFFCGSSAQPVGHLLKAGPLAAPGVPSMCDRVGHTELESSAGSSSLLSEPLLLFAWWPQFQLRSQVFGEIFPDCTT